MSRKGFTLVEVLIVVAVIAILAGLAFGMMWTVEKANISGTEIRVHGLGIEVGKVLGAKGAAPATLEGLPFVEPGWMKDGRFVDNWDQPFEYEVAGKQFKLWSRGPDGVSGTADDLRYRRN